MKREEYTAKSFYKMQLEELHNLLWEMDCFHVNELNRSNNEEIKWTDCGSLGHIIENLKDIVEFTHGQIEDKS